MRQGQQSMALAAIALSLVLVAAAPAVGTSSEELAAVLQCHPAPALTDATDGTAFRASLLLLLSALPSAAAPMGFASLHSDGAFARGVCFGDPTTLPSGSECARCLFDAARNLTAGCGATSRRAGILSQRCSLWYADTNFSSPGQDAFRARFHLALPSDAAAPASDSETSAGVLYSPGLHDELVAMAQLMVQRAAGRLSRPAMPATMRVVHKTIVERGCGCDYAIVSSTVYVRAQCARDLTAADCARCLQDSAQAMDWDLDAARGDGGAAAAVVGFNCHVRFEVSTALAPRSDQSDDQSDHSGILRVGLLALIIANFILTVANYRTSRR
ncbi:hypothetical protein CFC21_022202 [Triticum aestivum]|uniref:Gnk2-homologous domain-containing protein n=2 Tax=Triticum aestivum TaxID=4565 RepID=A0A3B6C1M3_WHEAT|nr:uncharacterized protein LOC123043987 [Triticum aestivum]KAF7007252.1 hypothetical protein CFC21_022202 [Triticum aestivum]